MQVDTRAPRLVLTTSVMGMVLVVLSLAPGNVNHNTMLVVPPSLLAVVLMDRLLDMYLRKQLGGF